MPIPDYESFMLPALKALADRAETRYLTCVHGSPPLKG